MNFSTWKDRARGVRNDTYALYLACRDPRVPWYAKACAGLVVAYVLSPIDLIPDFIPVVGQLDELLIVPLGVAIVRRMVPAEVFAQYRETAEARLAEGIPHSVWGAVIIVTIWLLATGFIGWVSLRMWR